MSAFFAIIKKELIAHQRGFFIVPLILGGLTFLLAFFQLLSNNFQIFFFLDDLLPLASLESFNLIYGFIQSMFVPYIFVMSCFYFADSFFADTRYNNLLFFKSLPVSDAAHIGAKLAGGLAILPLLVLVATFVLGSIIALLFIITGQGTSIFGIISGLLRMTLTGTAMLAVILLWYAPLFALFALLGQLAGRWALPLGIGTLIIATMVEKIVLFGQSQFISELIWRRIAPPFNGEQIISLAEFHLRAQPGAVAELLIEALIHPHMVLGILASLALLSIALYHRIHWALR